MWNTVWVSPQGHRSVSVSRCFLLQAPQCPCSVWKRFSRDHCCRGRSKSGCQIVGSHTRWELTTSADFQLCLHRLLMSTGCKSSHNGFLDVTRSNGGLSISGWIGQLSCLTILLICWLRYCNIIMKCYTVNFTFDSWCFTLVVGILLQILLSFFSVCFSWFVSNASSTRQLAVCVDDCCLLTGDQPDISSKLCQAMEALQDRPVLFKWDMSHLPKFYL